MNTLHNDLTMAAALKAEGTRRVSVELLKECVESIDDYRAGLGFGSHDRKLLGALKAVIAAAPAQQADPKRELLERIVADGKPGEGGMTASLRAVAADALAQDTTAPAGNSRSAETGGAQSRAAVPDITWVDGVGGWRPSRADCLGGVDHIIVDDQSYYPRAAPSLTVGDDRLTVASIAMAANVKALRLMQAIEQAGEGNVTLNQKLTMDQALQAIAALAPAEQAEPAPWSKTVKSAALLLQRCTGMDMDDCENLAGTILGMAGRAAQAEPATGSEEDVWRLFSAAQFLRAVWSQSGWTEEQISERKFQVAYELEQLGKRLMSATRSNQPAQGTGELPELPSARLHCHELIESKALNPTLAGMDGVWIGCKDLAAVKQSHTPGETGDEILALYTADQMHAYARAALAQSPAAVPHWQPIETAPMDGTEFWGYRERDGKQATASRVPRDDCEMWSFGGSTAAIDIAPELKPNYWMPIPASPSHPEAWKTPCPKS